MRHSEDRTIPTEHLRLGDLQECHVVSVTCWRCKHSSIIPLWRLKRRRPLRVKLIDIGFHMRCTNCDVRGAQTLRVEKLPPHA